MDQSVISRPRAVADSVFGPGHLGELTQIVSFDLVDAALAATRSVQRRVRTLPSRVVVYLLLAGALFEQIGYRQVWARLVSGLDTAVVATPSTSALSQALRRVGPDALRALFDLLAGPAAGAVLHRWHLDAARVRCTADRVIDADGVMNRPPPRYPPISASCHCLVSVIWTSDAILSSRIVRSWANAASKPFPVDRQLPRYAPNTMTLSRPTSTNSSG